MSLFADSAARSGQTNPFDFGQAAQPLSQDVQNAFNNAVGAWYQSRDKIQTETIPNLDRAIGAVQSWATAIEAVADVLNRALPITGLTTPANEGRIQELMAKAAEFKQLGAMLVNVRAAVPTLARAVNTLVARQ